MKYYYFFGFFLIGILTFAQEAIVGKYVLIAPYDIQLRPQDPNNTGTLTIRETLLNTSDKTYKLYRIERPKPVGGIQRQQNYNAYIPQNKKYDNLYVRVEGDIDKDNLIIYTAKIKHIYTDDEVIKGISQIHD